MLAFLSLGELYGIVCIEGGRYGSDIPRLHFASLSLNSFRILLLKHLHI